jgi:hypothetical protein
VFHPHPKHARTEKPHSSSQHAFLCGSSIFCVHKFELFCVRDWSRFVGRNHIFHFEEETMISRKGGVHVNESECLNKPAEVVQENEGGAGISGTAPNHLESKLSELVLTASRLRWVYPSFKRDHVAIAHVETLIDMTRESLGWPVHEVRLARGTPIIRNNAA